jgi:hypothetical protein
MRPPTTPAMACMMYFWRGGAIRVSTSMLMFLR